MDTQRPDELPFISIIVPCRNEAKHIAICLQSIVDQDYPRDKFEVLVVDGMSTDGTRDVLRTFAEAHPNVKIIDNPKKTAPPALNIGIEASKADFISRIDGHASVHPDYLKNCVKTMRRTDADLVGGRMETKGIGFWGKFIADVLSSVFGVGLSFRTYLNYQGYVDTVAFGLYKREALVKAGLFQEKMTRGQDWYLSREIIENGGCIYYDPSIRAVYYCTNSYLKFVKKAFVNGYWIASMPDRVALRHLAPSFLIGILAFTLYLSFRRSGTHHRFFYQFLPMVPFVGAYLGLSWFYSIKAALKHGFHAFIVMPLLYLSLHLSYGLGTVTGLLSGFWLRKARE